MDSQNSIFVGEALSSVYGKWPFLHRVSSLKGHFFFHLFLAWAQYDINCNNCAMNFSGGRCSQRLWSTLCQRMQVSRSLCCKLLICASGFFLFLGPCCCYPPSFAYQTRSWGLTDLRNTKRNSVAAYLLLPQDKADCARRAFIGPTVASLCIGVV